MEPQQHYQTHPEEEYKQSHVTAQTSREHFKINLNDNSPLELSKPYQGTPSGTNEDDVEDEDDQQSSNVQPEHIQIDFGDFIQKPEEQY